MSSAVYGVETPQPKDVVEDSDHLKEAASQVWNEEETCSHCVEDLQRTDTTTELSLGAIKKEEEATTMASKEEDSTSCVESNKGEIQSLPIASNSTVKEEKREWTEREASISVSQPLENMENLEHKLENSNSSFVEKNVDWIRYTADLTNQWSFPVGNVSLASYPASNVSMYASDNAKRIPYCYAAQPSFIGIPTWIAPQTTNPTNSDIHSELAAAVHSHHVSNDSYTVDEEARFASLVLLKLKSVTGEDLLELPTYKRKKWKKENVAYSQNKEDRPWTHRTFANDCVSNSVDADATYRAWKRSKRNNNESSVIPPQTEVACRVKEEDSDEWSWVLGIVDSYSNNSRQYRIIDVEELGNEKVSPRRYYFVSPDNVIPLSNDSKHVLPSETRVLAIYPDTTVFYPATIRFSRKNGKQLYYALEFDDEDEDEEIVKHVPARYVIVIPE